MPDFFASPGGAGVGGFAQGFGDIFSRALLQGAEDERATALEAAKRKEDTLLKGIELAIKEPDRATRTQIFSAVMSGAGIDLKTDEAAKASLKAISAIDPQKLVPLVTEMRQRFPGAPIGEIQRGIEVFATRDGLLNFLTEHKEVRERQRTQAANQSFIQSLIDPNTGAVDFNQARIALSNNPEALAFAGDALGLGFPALIEAREEAKARGQEQAALDVGTKVPALTPQAKADLEVETSTRKPNRDEKAINNLQKSKAALEKAKQEGADPKKVANLQQRVDFFEGVTGAIQRGQVAPTISGGKKIQEAAFTKLVEFSSNSGALTDTVRMVLDLPRAAGLRGGIAVSGGGLLQNLGLFGDQFSEIITGAKPEEVEAVRTQAGIAALGFARSILDEPRPTDNERRIAERIINVKGVFSSAETAVAAMRTAFRADMRRKLTSTRQFITGPDVGISLRELDTLPNQQAAYLSLVDRGIDADVAALLIGTIVEDMGFAVGGLPKRTPTGQ